MAVSGRVWLAVLIYITLSLNSGLKLQYGMESH